MKLIIFSDIHKDWQALERIINKKADFYVCLGDLSNFGDGLQEAGEKLSFFREKLLLLPGNHETTKQAEELCQEYGFVFFHRKILKIGKYQFAGVGHSTITPFNTPGEVTEEQMEDFLTFFRNKDNLVLFTHTPAKETNLDLIPSGEHVGSKAVKKFLEEENPLYYFCGHIHESAGKTDKVGKTKCYNIGKQGIEIDI